jgi:hypothetical protein
MVAEMRFGKPGKRERVTFATFGGRFCGESRGVRGISGWKLIAVRLWVGDAC